MNITTPLGNNFASFPNYGAYQSYYYPRWNNSFPLAINPYVSLSGYNSYRYPSLSYSQYSYPSLIGLNAYPNTLSTILPEPTDWSKIKKIDVSTMPIVPEDLLEKPKPTDNRMHDLNPSNGFHYHKPDERLKFSPPTTTEPKPDMFRHLFSPLFTSSSNFQYIYPNGRIVEFHVPVPEYKPASSLTTAEVNKQIYEAKKAKGQDVVVDILGRPYNPNKTYNLNDNQDYLDESLSGQVLDYYKYNTLDPSINTPQNQDIMRNFAKIASVAPFNNPLGDTFVSDYLGSNTALISPRAVSEQSILHYSQGGNIMYPNFNRLNVSSAMSPSISGDNRLNSLLGDMQGMYNMASFGEPLAEPSSMLNSILSQMPSLTGLGSPNMGMSSLGIEMPSTQGTAMSTMPNMGMMGMPNMGMMGMPNMGMMGMPTMPNMGNTGIPALSSVFNTNSFNANNLVDKSKPFDPNEKSKMGIDYTGTNIGEFYHIMQYMQESLGAITQQKALFLDFNGNPVSQEFASKETTGNVPFFDVVSESYGWMGSSPYYQDFVQSHINGTHGGVHDVITPRGFDPEKFTYGDTMSSVTWGNNDVYKTPYARPVTITDPRLNLF